MGDCKDCKHFKPYEKRFSPFGQCLRVEDISVGEPEPKPLDGFFCSDREQYGAYLEVGPNFGCKHFSVNESK